MSRNLKRTALGTLNRSRLARLRTNAVRRGVWFRVLSRLERASVDLTIRVVEKVRSAVLAEALLSIVKKLTDAMESPVTRLRREVGSSLARKMSLIAQRWGSKSAIKWKADRRFIRYLTIMHLNASSTFLLTYAESESVLT